MTGPFAVPARTRVVCVSSVPPLLVVVGYWRFGAVPRAVPVVWNQYTFYSIGYTKTLVVATISYSTRHWYNVSRIVLDDPWLLHPPFFFLVALTATLLPLRPVGPDGLPIMIGASARQEPGFRGHPPGSWRKPRVPSHCYDDAAQFREAVFSGASPERVR